MKLRFTPRAAGNIAQIAGYIRQRNPTAARRVRASIYDSLQQFILFPSIGRQQVKPGARKFVTPRYPYLIYYTVNDAAEEIIILSVKHAAQERGHDDARHGAHANAAAGAGFSA